MVNLGIVVSLLSVLTGCEWTGVPPKVTFVLEDGFRGPIQIVEHASGQVPSGQDNRINVPANGVVFLNSLRVLREAHRIGSRYRSGGNITVYNSDVGPGEVALRSVDTSVCNDGPPVMTYVLGDAKAEAALRNRCVIWDGSAFSLPRIVP
jgi:hypothetical protein